MLKSKGFERITKTNSYIIFSIELIILTRSPSFPLIPARPISPGGPLKPGIPL